MIVGAIAETIGTYRPHRETGEQRWFDQAEDLVADVECVLSRRQGFRIGEAPERDGQSCHYLAMWLVTLAKLGKPDPVWRARGVAVARDIHRPFASLERVRDRAPPSCTDRNRGIVLYTTPATEQVVYGSRLMLHVMRVSEKITSKPAAMAMAEDCSN